VNAYFLKDRVKEKIPDFRRSCFSRTVSPKSVFLLCIWAIVGRSLVEELDLLVGKQGDKGKEALFLARLGKIRKSSMMQTCKR
jgi:hypothetical protein